MGIASNCWSHNKIDYFRSELVKKERNTVCMVTILRPSKGSTNNQINSSTNSSSSRGTSLSHSRGTSLNHSKGTNLNHNRGTSSKMHMHSSSNNSSMTHMHSNSSSSSNNSQNSNHSKLQVLRHSKNSLKPKRRKKVFDSLGMCGPVAELRPHGW